MTQGEGTMTQEQIDWFNKVQEEAKLENRLQKAKRTDLSDIEIDALIKDNNSTVRWKMVKNNFKKFSVDQIDLLLRDTSDVIRNFVAANCELTNDQVHFAMNDMSPFVLEGIAQNKELSKREIDLLIESPHTNVRVAVSGNRNLNNDHLNALSNDKSLSVIMAIANDPFLSQKNIDTLIQKCDDALFLKLIKRSDLKKKHIAFILANTRNFGVVSQLRKNQSLTKKQKVLAKELEDLLLTSAAINKCNEEGSVSISTEDNVCITKNEFHDLSL